MIERNEICENRIREVTTDRREIESYAVLSYWRSLFRNKRPPKLQAQFKAELTIQSRAEESDEQRVARNQPMVVTPQTRHCELPRMP